MKLNLIIYNKKKENSIIVLCNKVKFKELIKMNLYQFNKTDDRNMIKKEKPMLSVADLIQSQGKLWDRTLAGILSL